MTDTLGLIDHLAARAAPVRPLASPLRRTALWVAAVAVVVYAIALAYGHGDMLPARFAQPSVLAEWLASIATGVTAAYATFVVSVPGRDRRWGWLPVAPLVVWLAILVAATVRDARRLGADAFVMEYGSWECATAITVTSVPLGIVMLLMVRHAGVVSPRATAMLAALSTTALSAAGVSLYHHGEGAPLVLMWHMGAVLLWSALCLVLGRPLFGWIGHARR